MYELTISKLRVYGIGNLDYVIKFSATLGNLFAPLPNVPELLAAEHQFPRRSEYSIDQVFRSIVITHTPYSRCFGFDSDPRDGACTHGGSG
jgi:hypothetical protein